ncbi:hypothetical protein [Streptomyces coeruleorubidus]|uniref:hypothetical protein n=1 Tax=Streptomyces coeruleorubidus TaxID=116188 RepID=UPI003658BEEB
MTDASAGIIERLHDVLTRAGVSLGPAELVDILWLAMRLPSGGRFGSEDPPDSAVPPRRLDVFADDSPSAFPGRRTHVREARAPTFSATAATACPARRETW